MNQKSSLFTVSSSVTAWKAALVWVSLYMLTPFSSGAEALDEDLALSRAAISERRWNDALQPTLRAAEAGHIPSQSNLANLYAQGLGVEQSWPEARRWWKRAADAGYVTANLNFALALLTGDGGPIDEGGGMKYLRCAALLGNSTAQHQLADRLAKGDGKQLSPERLAWYWIAADSGSYDAERELVRFGERVPEKKAAKMLDQASLLFLSSECPRDTDGLCRSSSLEGRRHNAKALSRRLRVHQMISRVVSRQGFVDHAGDEGRRATQGVLEVLELTRSALPEEDRPLMKIAVSSNVSVNSQDVVRMPVGDFWNYLQPGDSVLLSDRVTHHYTIVFGVDPVTDQIFMADAWPDRFFALEDPEFRQQGVSLTQMGCGKRLVKMPRKLFEELVVSFSGIRDHDWPPAVKPADKKSH
jgi:hypothetical protein